ncbi:MAG TPA: sulfotransferase [Deltaproteobacteria bacterium]|nr:sulfotransferase [Deltaproteobacteria bacterium]
MTRPGAPMLVNALNRGGRAVKPLLSLDADTLIAAAKRKTRLEDLGDPGFREPLDRLVGSLDREAHLSLFGRIAARKDLGRLLASRLRMVDDRRLHPQIADEEVRRPLIITGFPRTGTTILHAILAQDPRHRVPLTWETMYPSPPPRRVNYHRDRRIGISAGQLSLMNRLSPDFKRIHPIGAQLPQECLVLSSIGFESYQFQTMYNVPSYQKWLDEQDLRRSYEGHKFFLQNLQWRCPGDRWVLKAPAHVFGFDALFATYPDAGVVMTHRAPGEVIGSLCSLTAVLRGAFSEQVDRLGVGREMTERFAEGMRLALEARDSGRVPADRFLDVDYRELVRDPLAAVRKIYTHFGIDWCPEAAERMTEFLARNPKDKHGKHSYALEQFGLDREQEEERYRSYAERFDL